MWGGHEIFRYIINPTVIVHQLSILTSDHSADVITIALLCWYWGLKWVPVSESVCVTASHVKSICKHVRLAARKIIAQWGILYLNKLSHSAQLCSIEGNIISYHWHWLSHSVAWYVMVRAWILYQFVPSLMKYYRHYWAQVCWYPVIWGKLLSMSGLL